MIEFSENAMRDLQAIRTRDGIEQMLTLLEWSERLSEPATRMTAEHLGGERDLFRLRVGDYHIMFQLRESTRRDSIRITRIRLRKPLPPL